MSKNSSGELLLPTVDPVMLGATLVQFGICSAGLVINGFLVYTIFRNKQLRSTSCFLLILALIICDCLAEFALISVSTVLTLTNTNVSLLTCFYLESYGLFAIMNTMVLMLLISLDRLWSISMPLNYKNVMDRQLGKYVSVLLTVSTLPSSFHIYIIYQYVETEGKKRVFCMPSDLMDAFALAFAMYSSFFLNLATILVYLSIWMMIRCKIVKLAQSSVETGLLRSMYVLIAVTFFCFLPVPIGGNWVIPSLQLSATVQNVLMRILFQLIKIGQAGNGIVLYVCSSEYRQAIQKELRRIFRLKTPLLSHQNNNSNITGNNIVIKQHSTVVMQ